MENINLLWLVEDDPISTLIIKKVIEKEQRIAKLRCFSNGQEAWLALLEEQVKPNVILLDLNMPVMDGWDFLDRVQKQAPKYCKFLNIYILSSSISSEDQERAASFGCARGYTVKPLNSEKLNALIQQICKQTSV